MESSFSGMHAARSLADQGRRMFRDAHLSDLKDSAQKMAAHYYNQGRHSLRHGAESVEHFVEEQPIRTALLALGIGCIVAAMLIRR